MSLDKVLELDRLFVQQKFTALVNVYTISTVADDGRNAGSPLAYVKQKRLKIREQIDFFGDENQSDLVMRVKARKVFEVRGRSEVQLPDGTVIGQLQKVFGKSLLRSTWEILDAAGSTVIASAQERSMAIAVLRRVWGFIPIVGNVPFLIPFHFDISINGQVVGHYNRIPALVDRYVMDLTGDPNRVIDRRVAIGFAIALDALQDR